MNRKITKIAFSIIFIGIFVYCSNNKDDHYFNGDIRYFDSNSMTTKNVEIRSVPLDGICTGVVAVYDSLLICWSPDFADHFFNVLNVDTGKELGSFCGKGRGPEEAVSVGCIFQLFKKGDDLMTLLYADNEGLLFIWNISESVRGGTTVFDAIIPYDNDRIRCLFYQSEDVLFAYKPYDDSKSNEIITPFYEKRTIHNNELIREYPIYKTKSVKSKNANSFLYTWDAIKPDGSKIVQCMSYLPQINIIDTYTGNVVGYRMKNGPDFSILEKDIIESLNKYYNCVHADDNYIYATYWGKEPWDGRGEFPIFNTIHVFDWNGKPLYELITDRSFFNVWSDPVRNRLYAIDMNTDEVYYLDLDELNLI